MVMTFPELSGLTLMPGEQQDISQFSQKERDNCFDLQDAFRRSEIICVGVGQNDRPDIDVRMRMARARYQQNIEDEPIVEPEDLRPPTYEEEESYIDERTGVKIIENPAPSILTQNKHGATEIHYIPPPVKENPHIPKPSLIQPKHPTITPERAREILSKKCAGTKTNGRACKRWACTGFEYCIQHMPEDLRKIYKQKKKDDFFD